MRLVSAAVAASLLVPSSGGCALAVAPAVGIGVGAAIGIARQQGNSDASIAGPAIIGGLVGVIVDALAVGYLIYLAGENFDLSERRAPDRARR
jgi:hypothetical protein